MEGENMGAKHFAIRSQRGEDTKSDVFGFFTLLIILIFLVNGCSSRRFRTVEQFDDGKISATLEMNRSEFREGEQVQIRFILENTSAEVQVLSRSDAVVQDLFLYSYQLEKQWSIETDNGVHELRIEPGESSTVEWVIEDLETGGYTLIGSWWSRGVREQEIVIPFTYGPWRY
jgi:hypothetical protein